MFCALSKPFWGGNHCYLENKLFTENCCVLVMGPRYLELNHWWCFLVRISFLPFIDWAFSFLFPITQTCQVVDQKYGD